MCSAIAHNNNTTSNSNGLTRQKLTPCFPNMCCRSSQLTVKLSAGGDSIVQRYASNVCDFHPKQQEKGAWMENQALVLKSSSWKYTHHLLMKTRARNYSCGTVAMEGGEKGSLPRIQEVLED